MDKNFIKNLSAYLTLFSGLILGFFFFLLFSYNRQLQLIMGVLISVYYLSWGIVYHLLRKDLTIKVLSEYLFIALIGIVILSTLLIRT